MCYQHVDILKREGRGRGERGEKQEETKKGKWKRKKLKRKKGNGKEKLKKKEKGKKETRGRMMNEWLDELIKNDKMNKRKVKTAEQEDPKEEGRETFHWQVKDRKVSRWQTDHDLTSPDLKRQWWWSLQSSLTRNDWERREEWREGKEGGERRKGKGWRVGGRNLIEGR